ncbi:hypothetical protein B5X24_HaOG202244 [Helicoverpa armigera]|uniref:Zinc finger PHD-type domain-containing protein n=1 Tax=Helicoverpa armigera TaxID=29058 RepID=A0A2W1BTF2_HELAM|nr:hypothetical protein B5X24_HaOG202244 [Helicoverpa armigera]
MVIKKCVNCNSNITKKNPGLECSRCEKTVHATNACAKLSVKQLAALRASDGLEWCCTDCLKNISRRSSFFIPDDTEEASETVPFDVQRLMKNISAEIKKAIKEELESFQASVEFIGDQVSNIEEILKNQNSKIRQLENKNIELMNAKKNLELRLSAMEQRMEETEQKNMCNFIEIAGLPNIQTADVMTVTKKVADILNLENDVIQDVRQITGRSDSSSYLLVELNNKSTRNKWISAAKSKEITVAEMSLSIPVQQPTSKIFVREALTRNTKTMLYQAKQRLKAPNGFFKYVWCKEGKVYVKKSDDDKKVHIIRSTDDIDVLISKHNI